MCRAGLALGSAAFGAGCVNCSWGERAGLLCFWTGATGCKYVGFHGVCSRSLVVWGRESHSLWPGLQRLLIQAPDATHAYSREQTPLPLSSPAIPFQHHRANTASNPFSLLDLVVGQFSAGVYPSRDGEVRYEPFRGPGHLQLQTALKAAGGADCYFSAKMTRVAFRVAWMSSVRVF